MKYYITHPGHDNHQNTNEENGQASLPLLDVAIVVTARPQIIAGGVAAKIKLVMSYVARVLQPREVGPEYFDRESF